MGTFVNDNFTGASGTTLASHATDSGATWAQHPSAGALAQISSANRCRGSSSSTALYYTSTTSSVADYSVQADFWLINYAGASAAAGVAFRLDTTANTYYRWFYLDDFGAPGNYLYKVIAGVETNIGAFTTSPLSASGSSQTLLLVGSGSSLTGKVNGGTKVTATDSAISAKGQPGVYLSGPAGDANGGHLDVLSAFDSVTQPIIPDRYYRKLQAVSRSFNW